MKIIFKKPFIFPLLLFIFVFSIYFFTVARYHVSIADSDEFALIGSQLGIAHPPGYPVYVFILFIATHIIPIGSNAFKVGIVSAFFDACSAVFIYFSTLLLLRMYIKKDVKHHDVFLIDDHFQMVQYSASFLGALMLSFSFLFWLYSNVPEVFALNNFYVSLLVFLSLRIGYLCLYMKKMSSLLWYLLSIISLLALGLNHLQTIIVIYPIIIAYVVHVLWKSKMLKSGFSLKNICILVITFFVFFTAPLVFIVVIGSMYHSVSWPVGNIWSFFTRQYYATHTGALGAYAQSKNTLQLLSSIPPYLHSVSNDFSFFPLLFVTAGFIYLFIKNRINFVFMLLLYLFGGIFLAAYIGFPSLLPNPELFNSFLDIAITQRQFIMGDVLLAPFIGVGIYGVFISIYSLLMDEDKKQKYMLSKEGKAFLVSVIICILMVGFEFITNIGQTSLHDFNYIERFSQDALQSADKNSLIMCFSDLTCNAFLYEQQVNHIRPDLLLVPYNLQLRQAYYKTVKNFNKFSYPYSPFDAGDVISWNIKNGRTVYVADVITDYINFIGLDDQAYFLIPNGYLHKVATSIPSTLTTYSFQAVKDYINYYENSAGGINTKNYFYLAMSGLLTRPIGLDSYYAWKAGDTVMAKDDLDLQYRLTQDFFNQQDYTDTLLYYSKNKNVYKPGDNVPSASDFLQQSMHEKNISQEINDARFATFEEPLNIDARVLLMDLYKQSNEKELAVIEAHNILRIDSSNNDAKSFLRIAGL